MLKKILGKASRRYPFGKDDFLQQVIGSALLSAPFIFTEEVWTIASNTSNIKSLLTVATTFAIGHGILYVAKEERDFDTERKFLWITYRYISLMAVTFGSVIGVLLLTATAQTFDAGPLEIFRAVSLISVFSVIGAATADNLI